MNDPTSTFAPYLADEEVSDFQIICQDFTFNVHKLVLKHSSPYFNILFASSATQNAPPPVDANEVQYNNAFQTTDRACLVARMLQGIYLGNYTLDPPSTLNYGLAIFTIEDPYILTEAISDEAVLQAELAVQMYHMGLKYEIPQLAKMAYRHLMVSIEDLIMKVEAPVFKTLLRSIYETKVDGDHKLTDLLVFVVQYAVKHNNFQASEQWVSIVRDVPEFNLDLALSRVADKAPKCLGCQMVGFDMQRRCDCGSFNRCYVEEHAEERKGRSICLRCKEVGTRDCKVLRTWTGAAKGWFGLGKRRREEGGDGRDEEERPKRRVKVVGGEQENVQEQEQLQPQPAQFVQEENGEQIQTL